MNAGRMLPPAAKRWLKEGRRTLTSCLDRLFAADQAAFRQALRDLGMQAGEILYVRSSYDEMGSLHATPLEIIEVLSEIVGPSGTLVMPTYPMTGLSQPYLEQHPFFDWRRTPSRSGLLTEIFRRLPGTERSLHPTHPIAARGLLAKWLAEGHEQSETPFDARSPFHKLLERNAFILSIGRFEAMTLRHFADHLIQDRIPYPIYAERPIRVGVISKNGKALVMHTKAHNPDLGCDHRIVLRRMAEEGILKTRRVGRVPMSLVRLQPYIEAYQRYYGQGLFRHYLRSRPSAPRDTVRTS